MMRHSTNNDIFNCKSDFIPMFVSDTRTTALTNKLAEFNLGSDKHTFLSKLTKNIFSSYLESYIDMERDYLRTRSAQILQRFYDSKNHQKRLIGTGRWDLGFTLNAVGVWNPKYTANCPFMLTSKQI